MLVLNVTGQYRLGKRSAWNYLNRVMIVNVSIQQLGSAPSPKRTNSHTNGSQMFLNRTSLYFQLLPPHRLRKCLMLHASSNAQTLRKRLPGWLLLNHQWGPGMWHKRSSALGSRKKLNLELAHPNTSLYRNLLEMHL